MVRLYPAVLVPLTLAICACAAAQSPDYVRPCKQTLPSVEFNTCLKDSLNFLRPYLARGIPELNVPPLEPLHIKEMSMQNGNGPVQVNARFTDMSIAGPGDYEIKEVRIDLKSWKIAMAMKIPRVDVSGLYDVNGQVLLFPLRSRGTFSASFTDVSAVARVQGVEMNRNGTTFLKVAKITIDFNVKGSKFKVRDTVNNENIIGEAMNQFLNTNGNEIINEMRPAASLSIAKIFKVFLEKALDKISIDSWIPKN